MSQSIDVFSQCRRLAVVGVSRARRKYGKFAYRELKARGLDASVEGDACFKSLAELPRPVDGVLVCVRPEKVPEVLRQAAAAGIRRAWLQQGAESDAAAKLAAQLGIDLVQGECILMHASPVRGFHRLHRGLWRLLGRLTAARS
jgi:hypothetical protein